LVIPALASKITGRATPPPLKSNGFAAADFDEVEPIDEPVRQGRTTSRSAKSSPRDWDEEEAEPEEKQSKRALLLAIGIPVLLLVLGGGGYGIYALVSGSDKDKKDGDEKVARTGTPEKPVENPGKLPGGEPANPALAQIQDQLLGKWKETGFGMVYEFNKDGTVVTTGPGGKGQTNKGTYKILDEKTIEIRGADGKSKQMAMVLSGDRLELTIEAKVGKIEGTGADKLKPGSLDFTLVFTRADKAGTDVVKGNDPNPLPPIGTDPPKGEDTKPPFPDKTKLPPFPDKGKPPPFPDKPKPPDKGKPEKDPPVEGTPWPKMKSADSGKKIEVLEELQVDIKEPVNCVALSPDGKTLAAAWDRIHLWDVSTDPPKEKAVLEGHPFQTRAVAFSPDGKLLVTGGAHKVIHLWDLSGDKPKKLPVAKVHDDTITALAFSPDGKTLASGADDKAIVLWDVGADKLTERAVLKLLNPRAAHHIKSLAFSPDGKLLAAAGQGTWEVWDVTKRAVVQGSVIKNVRAWEMPIGYSPDGKALALVADNAVHVLVGRTPGVLVNHTERVTGLAFSPDGKTLISVGEDGRAVFLDVPSMKRREVRERPGKLSSVAFASMPTGNPASPDQLVAIGNKNNMVLVLHLGYAAGDAAPEKKEEKKP
jgi:glucose/arabinose dehydrogenase